MTLFTTQRWSGAANSCVPPTAVTSGSLAGELAALIQLLPSQLGWAEPSSPLEAKRVIPLRVASLNTWCCWRAIFGSTQPSASPKLCEMTSPTLLSTAHFVAARMSASSFDLARTSSILAPGAMACAHSTSREISADQPTMLPSVASNGVSPCGASWWKTGSGSPKAASNAARSSLMSGFWKASTITIVRPRPSKPLAMSLSNP